MLFDGELRFLDESDINGDRTVFTSYPKSGASLLRNYLQQATGIIAGSDFNLTLSLPGQMNGLKG
jgi:hypothetical protein